MATKKTKVKAKPRAKKAVKRAAAKSAARKRTPAKRPVSSAAARPAAVIAPAGQVDPVESAEATPAAATFPIEIDPQRVEDAFLKLREEVVHWANKGRYTKVRFKFRGKQLLPDLPLAAVVAAEGLTFYWAGILRVLAVNFAGGALFNVELVNDSEKKVQEGKDALLSGDADNALELFRRAVEMERDNANAHLHIGVALKLKGDKPGARAALEKARALDPKGSVGSEAERILSTLTPPAAVVVSASSPSSP